MALREVRMQMCSGPDLFLWRIRADAIRFLVPYGTCFRKPPIHTQAVRWQCSSTRL